MDLVDDRYIEETADAVLQHSRTKRWKQWTALAACLCLMLAGCGKLWWDSLRHDLPGEEEMKLPQSQEEYTGEGLWIPYMVLPEETDGLAMDMAACVVYKGGIYTQFSDGYYDEDADRVRGLLGEKLGTARGNLNEWSTQDAYTKEFAGSISGTVYEVNGYDPSFRIAVAGKNHVLFLERLNGIAVDTGSDLFDERLHLTENWKSLAVLDHETWYYAEQPLVPEPIELAEQVWEAFLTEIGEGKFENLWNEDPDQMKDVSGRTIYDRIAIHLYVTMQDGTVNHLRISEDGYVLYDGLLWYGVKLREDTLVGLLEACK